MGLSDDTAATVEAPALPGDGLRESIVDDLRRAIGDGLVEFKLTPQDDLWVRVRADAWAATGRALRERGFTYFCFLSAIDWMPSPYGRGEDDPTQPPPERSTEVKQGYAGGETRFQVFARVTDIERHVGVTLKVDVADEPFALDSWHAIYARRQLARARDPRDVRHRLRRPPRPAQHVPAHRVRGLPAAQGLPAARPHGQAVAGHRRRRADARRGGRTTRAEPGEDADSDRVGRGAHRCNGVSDRFGPRPQRR